jgi:hypothetical protein
MAAKRQGVAYSITSIATTRRDIVFNMARRQLDEISFDQLHLWNM